MGWGGCGGDVGGWEVWGLGFREGEVGVRMVPVEELATRDKIEHHVHLRLLVVHLFSC